VLLPFGFDRGGLVAVFHDDCGDDDSAKVWVNQSFQISGKSASLADGYG
jgi:hypothetical protein